MTPLVLLLLCAPVDYPIVAVRSSRTDQTVHGYLPDVFQAMAHPSSDLVLRKPDGTQEVLVDGAGVDANFDPKMSLDGQWCYFVKITNNANRNWQRGVPVGPAVNGADIYRIHLTTKQVVRLTAQNWTPPTSIPWMANPSGTPAQGVNEFGFGYGVHNMGPCPLPGGKVAFTSNRRGFGPPKGYANPHQQLFVLDDVPGTTDQDGESDRNLECIGHLNVSNALHPTLMTNGEINFASHETQGLRDSRMWGVWKMQPDGRGWGPIFSAYAEGTAYHFQTQRTDGSIAAALYYNLNNWGFGTIVDAPLEPTLPAFLSPRATDNPPIPMGYYYAVPHTPESVWFSTMRRGMDNVFPWATAADNASGYPNADGTWTAVGKVTHPAGAPNNALLVSFSPGKVNALNRPLREEPHSKVGIVHGKKAATPEDIEILLEHADYHFTQPIAAVPWATIYGSDPPEHPFCPNPTGTPFARLQLSSSHLGQWKPEPFPGRPEGLASVQGHWSGHPQEIPAGIDIVAFEPDLAGTYWTYPDGGWSNAANERVRLLARVMFDEPDRPAGDTSADILIPADVPYGMRSFAADGRTITFSQTWKQTRPGEVQQCGGCHNHSGAYIPFEATHLSPATYASLHPPKDFRQTLVRTPEFNRDVKPIIDAKCASCHNESHPVKLDATLARSIYVKPSMAYASRLSKAIHGEGETQRMPLGGEPLTAAEMLKIDEWIDYFCLVATPEAADRDLLGPTVYVPREGPLKIGAWDYLSGLASITCTVNGEAKPLPAPVDGVYDAGYVLKAGDRVKVVATDNAGNKTTVERFVTTTVEPPPPPPTLKQELLDLIDMLRTKVGELP